MDKKNSRTLVTRLAIMSWISCGALGLFLAIICGVFINNTTSKDYEAIAKAASTHVYSWMEQLDNGNYTYNETTGKLMKGTKEITDDAFWMINKEDNDMHHTIFWGKTRILSDLTDDSGKSVVGTELTDMTIIDSVEKTGIYTSNNVTLLGSKYTVCYVPIKNGDEIVGMVFTGVNQSAANGNILKSVLLAVGLAILITFIISIIVNRVVKKWADEFSGNLTGAAVVASDRGNNVIEFGKQTQETMEQINVAIDQVSGAVTSQASYTEEIMGTMEEFGASLDIIVNDVQNTSEIAQQSISAIDDLKKQLNELEDVSNENSREIETISSQIEEDSKAVSDIGKIIDVINDIAFQITILSFNASVEAARAGEFGKGFAVVADSIKDLSDKTKESLADITGIVDTVNLKMLETSESSTKLIHENDKVTQELAMTKEKLDLVTSAYSNIITNIEKVLEQADAIIAGKNQVVDTVSSLAAMSEENAAMSEEVKASSDEVINITGKLITEIDNLEEVNAIIDDVKMKFS